MAARREATGTQGVEPSGDPTRTSRLSAVTHLRRAILVLVLGLSCLLGFLSAYLLILLGLIAAALLLPSGEVRFDRPAQALAAVFAALLVVFAVDATQPRDLVYALNFVVLLTYAPLASVLQGGAGPANTVRVADLALVGAALGCAFAVFDGLVLGHARAGSMTTDPIRLADTTLILGFLGLMGIIDARGKRRWLYLLGPAFAIATIFLSGSRGALLAFGPMALVATFLLVRRPLLAIGVSAGALVLLAALVSWTDVLGARAATLVGVFGDMLTGSAVGDEQSRIRLELYRAGWSAFTDRPLLGHGWAGMMPSVVPYLPDADKAQATLPHLHNELLTLAVAAGVVGIVSYFVLMALPIVATLRMPRDGQYRARFFGVVMLTVSYFMLGLPDTMLAFELHTALYVGFLAILLGYCRDRPT